MEQEGCKEEGESSMIKGDKIRLVKPMGAFKNVGEICEVTDIAEGGVISFRFGGYHLGCMSYDEFLKYFEKVEERIWTKWEEVRIGFHDMNDKMVSVVLRHRNNGNKVQVKCGALKSESSCHSEDTFDFDKGFELATKRLIVKYIDNQVKSIAKGM